MGGGGVRDRSVKRVTYHLSFSLELLKGVTEKHFRNRLKRTDRQISFSISVSIFNPLSKFIPPQQVLVTFTRHYGSYERRKWRMKCKVSDKQLWGKTAEQALLLCQQNERIPSAVVHIFVHLSSLGAAARWWLIRDQSVKTATNQTASWLVNLCSFVINHLICVMRKRSLDLMS